MPPLLRLRGALPHLKCRTLRSPVYRQVLATLGTPPGGSMMLCNTRSAVGVLVLIRLLGCIVIHVHVHVYLHVYKILI